MGFGALRTAVMSICIGLALQVFALQPGMASDRSAAVPSVELEAALRHENAMVSAMPLSRIAVLTSPRPEERPKGSKVRYSGRWLRSLAKPTGGKQWACLAGSDLFRSARGTGRRAICGGGSDSQSRRQPKVSKQHLQSGAPRHGAQTCVPI